MSKNGDDDMKQSTLSIDLLRRILAYNPESGAFVWREATSAKVPIGSVAGVVASNGRRYIGILGEKHSAHRLAWFYHYGAWPTGNVRQENGNYDDCSIGNLVEESTVATAQRGALRSTNKSGVRGVSWSADKNKWVATITRDYRRVHIGYFNTVEEAETAYLAAAASSLVDKGTPIRSAAAIADRRRMRSIWQRVLRQNHAGTAWRSFNMFLLDVGQPPGEFHYVESVDSTKVIGPSNFTWVERRPTVRAIAERTDRKARPEIYRARDLRRNFGLEPEDFERLLAEQKGVCSICGEPETSYRDGKLKALAVDHDHNTDTIRGLLCSRCNPMIGYAQEDPERMRTAINFVVMCRTLFAQQNGKCAVCGDQGLRLILDRSLDEGIPRGLVCYDCKRTMTRFGDDSAKMRRAAAFLQHYRRVPGSAIEENLWEPIERSPETDPAGLANVVPIRKDSA
jgi:hypothetical protein